METRRAKRERLKLEQSCRDLPTMDLYAASALPMNLPTSLEVPPCSSSQQQASPFPSEDDDAFREEPPSRSERRGRKKKRTKRKKTRIKEEPNKTKKVSSSTTEDSPTSIMKNVGHKFKSLLRKSFLSSWNSDGIEPSHRKTSDSFPFWRNGKEGDLFFPPLFRGRRFKVGNLPRSNLGLKQRFALILFLMRGVGGVCSPLQLGRILCYVFFE